jgi:hypothetical protein
LPKEYDEDGAVKPVFGLFLKFEKMYSMGIKEIKAKLHSLIDQTDNGILLEDLLLEADSRIHTNNPHEAEGLSKEDYEELISLLNEPSENDTITYDELKSSLSRWFTK